MFLRKRPTDAATHDHGSVAACGVSPSLLEELAADSADFADLARVLGVDLDTVVATLVATRPATADELVVRLRERIAAGPSATTVVPAASGAVPATETTTNDDPLRHVRALCASVGERLTGLTSGSTTKDQRRTPSPWGGEERRGWGRWTRAQGSARVQRDGVDRPADPAVPATMVAP